MSVVVNEDVCGLCEQPVRPGEELRQMSGAGSIDGLGRIRLQWAHVDCLDRPPVPVEDVAPPPWQSWVRDLASDPFAAAQRLYELEQRVAALEGRRR
jgi:hypothetical protein